MRLPWLRAAAAILVHWRWSRPRRRWSWIPSPRGRWSSRPCCWTRPRLICYGRSRAPMRKLLGVVLLGLVACNTKRPTDKCDDDDPCTIDVCTPGSVKHLPTTWKRCKTATRMQEPTCIRAVASKSQQLRQCIVSLSEHVATSREALDADYLLDSFDACAEREICRSTPRSVNRSFPVFNSEVCEQRQFRVCQDRARDELAINTSRCLFALPAGWLAVRLCIADQTVKYVQALNRCFIRYTCDFSEHCCNQQCISRDSIFGCGTSCERCPPTKMCIHGTCSCGNWETCSDGTCRECCDPFAERCGTTCVTPRRSPS